MQKEEMAGLTCNEYFYEGAGLLEEFAGIRSVAGIWAEDFLWAHRGVRLAAVRWIGSGEVVMGEKLSYDDSLPLTPERILHVFNNQACLQAEIEPEELVQFTFKWFASWFPFFSGKTVQAVSLGAGWGLYESYLAYVLFAHYPHLAPRFMLVDGAPNMTKLSMKVATEIYGGMSISKNLPLFDCVRAVTADMANTGLLSGCADVVCCFNAIHWASDPRMVVREMVRLLNPKGLGLLFVVNSSAGVRVSHGLKDRNHIPLKNGIPTPELIEMFRAVSVVPITQTDLATSNGGFSRSFIVLGKV